MNFVEFTIILSIIFFTLLNVNTYENGENTKHNFISIFIVYVGTNLNINLDSLRAFNINNMPK